MIILVLGFVILVLFPGISVELTDRLGAVIEDIITLLIEPSALQLDAVDDLQLLPRRIEQVDTAVIAHVFGELLQGRLIGVIDEGVTGKAPLLSVALQKVDKVHDGVGRSDRDMQLRVIVYLFIELDPLASIGAAVERHRDRVLGLVAVRGIQTGREQNKLFLTLLVCQELPRPLRGSDVQLIIKVAEHEPRRPAAQTLHLVLVDLRPLGRVAQDAVELSLFQAEIILEGEEPMHPTVLRLLGQIVENLRRRIVLPTFERSGMVDIFVIHRQIRIIRVERCHHIVGAHARLTDKLNICRVDLVDIQTAVLSAQRLLPLRLVAIAHNVYGLGNARSGCEDDMRDLIGTGTVAVVPDQRSEIIKDPEILLNDILLSGTGVIGGDDMQLLRRLRDLQHKLEDADGRLACHRRALKKFDRRLTTEKVFVFLR